MKVLFWLTAALLTCFVMSHVPAQAAPKELNLLCWVSYEERSLLEPFEKKYNVRVKYKTFVSDDQMYALLATSKNQYDVVTLGPEYVQKLQKLGRLAALDPKDYNFADYIEPFKKFPLCWSDGKLYAVIDGYGANAILYNTNHLTAKDVETYDILWSPKVKKRVGIWDWYLPTMGTLSSAIGNNSDPTNLSNEKFQVLTKKLMNLRPQVAAVFGSPTELTTAVANDQVWIVPGCGEWVAAIVREQGKPVDWTIPSAGGQMWIEALSIPRDAPHPDVAKLYIQWMQTPEAQKLKSERKAYNCNVPNIKAYDLMTEKHRDALKVHNEQEAIKMISKLAIRRLPSQQPETQWQDVWQRFKAGQ